MIGAFRLRCIPTIPQLSYAGSEGGNYQGACHPQWFFTSQFETKATRDTQFSNVESHVFTTNIPCPGIQSGMLVIPRMLDGCANHTPNACSLCCLIRLGIYHYNVVYHTKQIPKYYSSA